MNTKPAIDPRTDELLTALASIVVDELIQLKAKGMTPEQIQKLYDEDILPLPTVKVRKRRQAKVT